MKNTAYVMIASQIGDASVLQRVDISPPTPEANQVMIRQTAIGVNFIDIYFRSGLYPWPQKRNLVLGSEGAGVVESVGSGISDFSIGDRVAYTVTNGAYATHRVVDASQLVHIPNGVTDDEAAAVMLKGLTAYYLLHDSYAVQAGETVLFHAAAGGVGSLAGQWLRSKGVHAIGTAGGVEKCKLAGEQGYESVIDYKNEDFVKRVKELTADKGVTAVYDSVGKDTLTGSLDCLQTFGTLVSFGQSSGLADQFRISDLARGSLNLCRPILFHYSANREWLEKASNSLFKLITDGSIKVNIGTQLPLENVGDAHKLLEGRKTKGSTVLIP